MTRHEEIRVRAAVKGAFEEGFYSYATPANSNVTCEQAWQESMAKANLDFLKDNSYGPL